MAQKSTAAAAVAVAVAVASFQMVGGKCLIPWRAPPCVGRGRRISTRSSNRTCRFRASAFRTGFCTFCVFGFRAGSARVVLLGFHARCRIQISLRNIHI